MFLIVKIVIITTRRLFIIIKTEADVNSRASCVRLSASTRTWCCQFVWPDCVLYCVAIQSPKLRKNYPKRKFDTLDEIKVAKGQLVPKGHLTVDLH